VENQVGVIRRRLFVPRPKFKSYAESNAWLEDRCLAYARANTHPEMRDKTIWEVFEEERPSLVPYVGPFDGVHAIPASVSKTCLIRFDKNRYSVDARAVGRPVEIRAYADRLECWQDGRIPCVYQPLEKGYRSWDGGIGLSAALTGLERDAAYEYINWYLDGWVGGFLMRQGY